MGSVWGLTAVMPVAAATTSTLAAATTSTVAAATTDVVLIGHGYGHGRGMGQYGAYGYAVDRGWSSEQILSHFYGGTRSSGIGSGAAITIRLTSMGTSITGWFTSGQSFYVGTRLVAAGSAARVVSEGAGWRVYTAGGGCSGTSPVDTGIQTSPRLRTAASPGDDVAKMLTVCSTGRRYRGDLVPGKESGGTVFLTNVLPVDSYLRSVVPSESPPSWADGRGGLGMQALRAQAVAARSFAWSETRFAPYAKTCDTTSCQMYRGAYDSSVGRVEDARTDAAVLSTAALVRVDIGGAGTQRTEFSSSSGGWTSGVSFPSVQDEGDSRSPYHSWTVRLGTATIAARYGVGTFSRLVVTQNGQGAGGGRAASVQIVGSSRSVTVSGDSFRTTFGLRSDYFYPAIQGSSSATGLTYLRPAWSTMVYRAYTAPSGTWRGDHAWVTGADYTASGSPAISLISTAYVKYSWSPTLYAVVYWPGEPQWQWHLLTHAEWAAAGLPQPRLAGYIYGTIYFKYAANPAIYAQAPDESVHHLTNAEWQAAGAPTPQIR